MKQKINISELSKTNSYDLISFFQSILNQRMQFNIKTKFLDNPNDICFNIDSLLTCSTARTSHQLLLEFIANEKSTLEKIISEIGNDNKQLMEMSKKYNMPVSSLNWADLHLKVQKLKNFERKINTQSNDFLINNGFDNDVLEGLHQNKELWSHEQYPFKKGVCSYDLNETLPSIDDVNAIVLPKHVNKLEIDYSDLYDLSLDCQSFNHEVKIKHGEGGELLHFRKITSSILAYFVLNDGKTIDVLLSVVRSRQVELSSNKQKPLICGFENLLIDIDNIQIHVKSKKG